MTNYVVCAQTNEGNEDCPPATTTTTVPPTTTTTVPVPTTTIPPKTCVAPDGSRYDYNGGCYPPPTPTTVVTVPEPPPITTLPNTGIEANMGILGAVALFSGIVLTWAGRNKKVRV